jgi:hypothetical protein
MANKNTNTIVAIVSVMFVGLATFFVIKGLKKPKPQGGTPNPNQPNVKDEGTTPQADAKLNPLVQFFSSLNIGEIVKKTRNAPTYARVTTTTNIGSYETSNMVVATKSDTILYASPSTTSEQKQTFKKGVKLVVIDSTTSNNVRWYSVSDPNKNMGFVLASSVTLVS